MDGVCWHLRLDVDNDDGESWSMRFTSITLFCVHWSTKKQVREIGAMRVVANKMGAGWCLLVEVEIHQESRPVEWPPFNQLKEFLSSILVWLQKSGFEIGRQGDNAPRLDPPDVSCCHQHID